MQLLIQTKHENLVKIVYIRKATQCVLLNQISLDHMELQYYGTQLFNFTPLLGHFSILKHSNMDQLSSNMTKHN